MKTRSSFFSLLFAATAFTFFSNCSGNKSEDATAPHEGHAHHDPDEHGSSSAAVAEATEPQFQVNERFQDQLSAVFTSYVDLKEAFVSTDAKKVQEKASETNNALAKVDMKLLTGAAHHDWMNYLASMEKALKEIYSSEDIAVQRESFSTLSDDLYKSTKAFGLGGKPAYYAYCPMAFNNEGAHWLSDQANIRNPYFGDKMLNCGQVKEKLK